MLNFHDPVDRILIKIERLQRLCAGNIEREVEEGGSSKVCTATTLEMDTETR